MLGARLDHQERGQQHHGGAQQAERLARGPAGIVAVDDRVHRRDQGCGDRDRAGHVDALAVGERLLARQQPLRDQEDGDADGDVDEEDPVPAQDVGQDAAEQHADRPAAGQHEAEDAHRLRALGGLGEQHHDQRERDGRDHRAAEALHRAGDDQDFLGAGQPAGERRHREDDDAGHEQAPVPEQVAEPAAEQQEPAEREQVGVHHPGERGLREAQIRPDRRQGDVHDRRVEDDHQVPATEHEER